MSRSAGEGPFLFTAFPVISFSGVDGTRPGAGEAEESAVGRAGTGGVTDDLRFFRGAALLLLFRGDGLFVGDAGSLGARLSSGSKICEGSIPSPVLNLRDLADFLGDALALAVVCLLVDFLGLRLGAGVNSSSLSSLIKLNSSSDSSTIIVLRAARRDGRAGDSADIAASCCGFCCWEFSASQLFVDIRRVDVLMYERGIGCQELGCLPYWLIMYSVVGAILYVQTCTVTLHR